MNTLLQPNIKIGNILILKGCIKVEYICEGVNNYFWGRFENKDECFKFNWGDFIRVFK